MESEVVIMITISSDIVQYQNNTDTQIEVKYSVDLRSEL